jgi:DNA-binding response OmpR family regulator
MAVIQHIGAHVITRLDSVHTLLVDNHHEIKFTRSEYPLVRRLLDGQIVSDKELVTLLFGKHAECDLWAREAVERHVAHIRQKFKRHHLKVYVVRIPELGYLLVSSSPLQHAQQPA